MGLGKLFKYGIINYIKKQFGGRKGRMQQTPRHTPEQQRVLDMLLKQGQENSDPQALEDRYTKQFEENTIPGIAERFTSMGGGQRSSAFASEMGRAGSDLNSQLAALRSQSGMQQLHYGLQPRFDTQYIPGKQGMMEKLIPLALTLATGGLGGGLAGGMAAGGLSSMFGGGGDQGQQPQQQNQQQPYNQMSNLGYMSGQPKGFMGQSVNPMLFKLLGGLTV